jgi:hypothetical protein
MINILDETECPARARRDHGWGGCGYTTNSEWGTVHRDGSAAAATSSSLFFSTVYDAHMVCTCVPPTLARVN